MKELNWSMKREFDFDNIPKRQGVYVISCNCNNGKSVVVYVGQTNDLKRRAKEHWSDNEQNTGLKNAIEKYKQAFCFCYAPINLSKDLDGCEKYLFNYYQPQFTDKSPDAEPIELALSNLVSKGKVNFK